MVKVCTLLCLSWPLSMTTPARADDTAAAREHWERGTKFYNLGKYDDAIKEFEAAYQAKTDPAFLYNLAQSHRLAGHNTEALRLYRTYLRNEPKAPNRAYIEARIKDLDKATTDRPATEPAPTVSPFTAPPSPPPPILAPTPGLDSMTAPATVPPSSSAGSPYVSPPGAPNSTSPSSPSTIFPPSYPPMPGSPGGGWPAPGASDSAPPGSFPATAPPGVTAPQTGSEGSPGGGASSGSGAASGSRKTAGLVLGIAGGGLFVVGAVFGLVARNQSKKVETAAQNNEAFDPSVESLGKTSQTLQWVGYGVGLAAAATGVILYATAPAPESATAPRVAFAPVVSHDLGGALMRVKF